MKYSRVLLLPPLAPHLLCAGPVTDVTGESVDMGELIL
jgi:hypothetical protein